jgi:hypothetical protein
MEPCSVCLGTGNLLSIEQFGDCQLHIEWLAPVEISGQGQGRGNSGVFFMGLVEVQVLDNYQNPTYADGMVGSGLWRQAACGECTAAIRGMAKLRHHLSPPDCA